MCARLYVSKRGLCWYRTTVIGDVEPSRRAPPTRRHQAERVFRSITTHISPDLVVSGYALSVLEVRTVCADDHRSAAAGHGAEVVVVLYGWRGWAAEQQHDLGTL